VQTRADKRKFDKGLQLCSWLERFTQTSCSVFFSSPLTNLSVWEILWYRYSCVRGFKSSKNIDLGTKTQLNHGYWLSAQKRKTFEQSIVVTYITKFGHFVSTYLLPKYISFYQQEEKMSFKNLGNLFASPDTRRTTKSRSSNYETNYWKHWKKSTV